MQLLWDGLIGALQLLVDRDPLVLGAAWRSHYERLHLHTARDHSHLPGLRFPEGTPLYPSP